MRRQRVGYSENERVHAGETPGRSSIIGTLVCQAYVGPGTTIGIVSK